MIALRYLRTLRDRSRSDEDTQDSGSLDVLSGANPRSGLLLIVSSHTTGALIGYAQCQSQWNLKGQNA